MRVILERDMLSPPVPVPELQGEPDDIVQEKCLLAVEKVSHHHGVKLRVLQESSKEALVAIATKLYYMCRSIVGGCTFKMCE